MENDKQENLESKKAPEENLSDSELDTVVGGMASGPAGLSSDLTATCITE